MDGHFTIHPEDGTLYTAASLDRETTPEYRLTITATDRATDVYQRRSSNTEVILCNFPLYNSRPSLSLVLYFYHDTELTGERGLLKELSDKNLLVFFP